MATVLDLETRVGGLGDTPLFRLLSDEKLERLHEASLWILEEVGVKVTTREALELLRDAGCAVTDGDVVKIPSDLVEDAIRAAPKRFPVYDRKGDEALVLGGSDCYFGTGATCLHFLDPESGEARDWRVDDFALVSRVADALPNVDFVGTPGVVRPSPELPQEVVNQHEFAAMVTNTTKPLTVLVANGEALHDILEMAAVVAGGRAAFQERPFVVSYLNCVSPLFYNAETLDKLLLAVEWHAPVLCVPSPQAGATAPVTMAGTIALSNAETLVGLVLAQLKRRGAAYIVGSCPAIMDMKTGNIAYGAPEQSLLTIAAAELARAYGLPVTGIGSGSDSRGLDLQTALEAGVSAYSCLLSGVHFMPYMGGLAPGYSPEFLVVEDEIVAMLKRIMRGVRVDDETLALDTIRSVGIGGDYLGEIHTLRHFRTELWQPTLLSRDTLAGWVRKGSRLLGDRAKERLAEILAGHRPEPLPDRAQAEMYEIVEARKRRLPGPNSY